MSTVAAASPEDDDEPSFDEVLEVIGQDAPSIEPLPQGRQVCARSQQPPKDKGSEETDGLVLADSSATPSDSLGASERDVEADEPETLEAAILALPAHWMRVYVRALYDVGDPVAARQVVRSTIGTVLPGTVTRFARECPAFGVLIAEHQKAQHEAVDAAVYRGATEGDLMPIAHQGVIMDTYRRRDTKAAIAHYQRHGLLASQQVQHTHTGRVEMVDDARMADVLDNVAKLLFGGLGARHLPAEKVIEAKVVSESDKKDG